MGRPVALENLQIARMCLLDAAWEFANAVHWWALADAIDCPLCHLLGVAKDGACPRCRPTARELDEWMAQ